MSTPVNYFYSIETVDDTGTKTKVECGPYALSAYDFSVVTQTALCYAQAGLSLKYAKKEVDSKGYPTGVVTEADYTVGPNGEWMTIPVNRLKP